MKTIVAVFLVLLFLTWGCAFSVQPAKSQTAVAIYIRSDGSVDSSPSPAPSGSSQQESSSDLSTIAMPVECVNYTVSVINASFWATVDGIYPIHIPSGWVGQSLPMVYPTPPGITDVGVNLDGQPVSWSNLTQTDPKALHYTYLGNWSMIICTIRPASTDFLLTIHYQHPIAKVNGSYVFLYDLNISPYLSGSSSSSVAYFNVRFETKSSDINVCRVPGDSSKPRDSIRTPVNFTLSQENGTEIVAFNTTSDYSESVPGDELITFQAAQAQVPEFPAWITQSLLISVVIGVGLLVYFKKCNH
jgi:hypothetical protein